MNADRETFTEWDFDQRDADTVKGWSQRLEAQGSLYRYMSLSDQGLTRFTKLALDSEMFFTPFSRLNDPFDGAVGLILDDGTPERIRAFWMHRFEEEGKVPSPTELARIEHFVEGRHDPAVHQQMQAAHDEEMANLGVRCFSEPPDDLSMWGYYADSHRGLCLRFSAPLMLGWGGFPPIRVAYEDGYPRASFYWDTRFGGCARPSRPRRKSGATSGSGAWCASTGR